MRRQALITMIDAASSAGTSDVVANTNCDLLSVQVSGTLTAVSVKVQGKTNPEADDWTDLAVFDKSSMELTAGSTGITAKGIYEANIAGVVLVRVSVTSVTGGNVTVVGSFENTSEN